MTYAMSRKQILQTLQSKITHLKSGNALKGGEEYWLGDWDIMLAALRSVLLYYKAEVVRCKHETLAYMKGLDAEDGYGDHAEAEALMQALGSLGAVHDRAEDLRKSYYAEKENPIEAAWRKQAWQDAEKLVQSKIQIVEQLTKDVEGVTYVGH